jgi:tetratricopeptide (TPR) repeat protein
MTLKDIQRLYERIGNDITEGRLLDALQNLKRLLKEAARSEYAFDWETLNENYRTLLKYTFEGYRDPQQKAILNSISASILGMADDLFNTLMLRHLPFKRSEKARLTSVFGEDPMVISAKIEEFLLHQELEQLMEDSEITSGEDAPAESMDNIFEMIWLTEKILDFHTDLVRKVSDSPHVEWPRKCLVVSALTLSVFNYFDINKLLLLTEFINKREHGVYQRALTGLLLALIHYDHRIQLYPELDQALRELFRDEMLRTEAELVFMQFLIARETERITKEFEEEVLPEMKKMMPKIEDKLQLGDITEASDMDDKNPEWKDMIDEVPGLFEKIERFSRMQMEGSDVFMGTFSMLKRFDFFNPIANWFLPFYKENPMLSRSFPKDDPYHDRLFEGLEKAFYICNSDKYSFALNFAIIPAQQRSMIVSYFEAELSQMKDFASEEQLLDQSLASNAVIIQYIQDLYRFFKLFPAKLEFTDVFQGRISFRELGFYKTFLERKSFIERVAVFHFDKEHWEEAIPMFTYLLETSEPRGDVYQKIAYACQMMGNYREAIGYYRKAELFDSDQLWIANKLGWCHMKLEEYVEAIRHFEQALKMSPDDPKLQGQIAQCHIQNHDYETALQIYTKLRFFMPANLRVLRPIAYCMFVLGRLEEAEEAYDSILADPGKKTMYDYMNAGHVKLCLGKRKHATELYKLSVMGIDAPWTPFFHALDEDTKWLLKNGLKPEEVPLLKDFLMYQF